MAIELTDMDVGTRGITAENLNQFAGRDRQVVINVDDGYRPVIMDGKTVGGKAKVALVSDLSDISIDKTDLTVSGETTQILGTGSTTSTGQQARVNITSMDGVGSYIRVGARNEVGTTKILEVNPNAVTIDGQEVATVDYIEDKVASGEFTGKTPNISVKTETLAAGTPASVTQTGTAENPIFTFGIPQGEKGEKGEKGDTGPQGLQGSNGPTGPAGSAASISNVTASVDNTTGTPSVTVSMGGTAQNRTFAFSFYRLKGAKGDKGDRGATGPQGPAGASNCQCNCQCAQCWDCNCSGDCSDCNCQCDSDGCFVEGFLLTDYGLVEVSKLQKGMKIWGTDEQFHEILGIAKNTVGSRKIHMLKHRGVVTEEHIIYQGKVPYSANKSLSLSIGSNLLEDSENHIKGRYNIPEDLMQIDGAKIFRTEASSNTYSPICREAFIGYLNGDRVAIAGLVDA